MVAETRRKEPHSAHVQSLLRGRSFPVIGLDLSADCTGVVIVDRDLDVLYTGTIEPDGVGPERLYAIHVELTMLARRYGPFESMVREDYSMGSTNRPYLLGEVGGLAQVALFRHVGGIAHVAPKLLKKFATGNAAASKEEVMRANERRHDFFTGSNDIADAYVLARIGACLAGYATPRDRPSLEVLAELRRASVEGPKPKRKAMRRQASVLESELDV